MNHRSSWVTRVAVGSIRIYVKVYDYETWRARLGNMGRWTAPWRPSRALRECRAFAWMTKHDFPAPRHFACMEQRVAGFVRRATILSSEVAGHTAEHLLRGADEHTRLAAARAVGQFVGTLHRAGFRDRNLDLRNLIVDGDRVTKIDSPRHRLVQPGDRDDALRRADWDRLLPQLAAFGVERAAFEAR